MKPMLTLACAALAFTVAPARAHHSAAVYYRLDEQITVEGIVTRFTLGNPHARIYLTVKGADGKVREWIVEGGSRTVLLRKGWTGDEVRPGDAVKVVGNPARDGSNVVHWQTLALADGRQLGEEDANLTPPEDPRHWRNGRGE